MTRNLFAVCVVSIALAGVGNAQGTVSSQEAGSSYTRSQVKELARTAHSQGQFKALAGYFGQQHKTYMQQAEDAKREWERRSVGVSGNRSKYPTPAEWAHISYEYYMSKASKASELEAKYSRLAEPRAPVNAE